MTPFKITCVTCQARLAVRSASLVGQILACPKCGSMVQVTAPAGHSVTDSVAGAAAVAPIMASTPDAPLASTFDDVTDFGAEVDSLAPPPAPAVVKPVAKPASKPIAKAAKGLSTTKLVAIGVSSALVGSALVAAALTLLRSDPVPPPVAAHSATTDVSPRVAPPSVEVAPTIEVEEPVVAAEAETTVEPASPPVATDDNPFEPAPAESAPSDAEPAVPDPAVAATAPPVVADAMDAAPDADAPRLRIDPLEFDPEGLDLATLMGGHTDQPADALALNDLEAEPAPPVESEAAEADEAAAPVPAGNGPPREDLKEAAADVEPPAAPEVLLARRVAGVKIAKMPLCRFLDFATALSAVPVSVAPTELRLAAVSAATPVSVDVKDATIEELLAAALKPLRLAPVVEKGQIVLRRAGEDRRRELAYPVDDLLDGDVDAATLAAWVERFVAPETWQAGGGPGRISVDGASLRIDHAERVGFETILFLEQYRTARGLAPRSKYPAALLEAWVAKGELATRLAAPATFTFSQPTALREMFRWWQEESDTAVLVDWPALGEQRLAPQSRAVASVTSQPWGDGLTAALAPIGLGWRAVDARTIEITTLTRMQSEPVVEMYRLAAAARNEAKLQARAGELAGAAALDADHGVLVVRQPAEAQRRLADWLAAEGLLGAEGPTGTAARSEAAAKPAAVSE